MATLDGIRKRILLKCAALRQKAVLRCDRELATSKDTKSAFHIYLHHAEKLSEKIGEAIRDEAKNIREMSPPEREECRKSCSTLILLMVVGLEGDIEDGEHLKVSYGDDLSFPAILESERNPKIKALLTRILKRALKAMIRRQLALLDLELDLEEKGEVIEQRSAPPTSIPRDLGQSKQPVDDDPSKDPRMIRLIDASYRFNIPKSVLSKAINKGSSQGGHIPCVRRGRSAYLYTEDVRRLARTREAYWRRRPPE